MATENCNRRANQAKHVVGKAGRKTDINIEASR